MRVYLPTTLILILVSLTIQAQSINAVTEREAEIFFNDLKDNLSQNSLDEEFLTSLYAVGYKGSTITLRPKRPPLIKNDDITSIINGIRRGNSKEYEYNYEDFILDEIVLNDPYAIMSYHHSYTIKRNDQIRLQSETNNTLVLKKVGDNIKIVAGSTVVNIPAEYIGTCFCRISQEDQNYSVSVEFPYGFEYERVMEEVYLIPGDRNLFIYEGKTYRWDGSSRVYRYNSATDSDTTEIGIASSLEMAMSRVIQNVAYKDFCLNMQIYSN